MKKTQTTVTAVISVVAVLLSVAWSIPQAADAGVLLRAGIDKEEVDGDLKSAIALYRQIVEEHGNNAAVAAQALYRLGWCHERLGSQEARNAYRRVIDEYSGQKDQVALARARLAELDAAAGQVSRKPTFRKIRIPANPGNGVLSPDGKRFAFVSQGSVWAVPIPGKVQPDLAGEAARLTGPMGAWNLGNTMAWSGDGKWIAFNVWNQKEGLSFYVVSAEGGEPMRVAVDRGGGINVSGRVSLSEDGRRVVFSSLDDSVSAADPLAASYFLYAIPVGGGSAGRLTDFWGHQPAFSHDGRKIAFARITALDNRKTRQDLWIINSDGSSPRKLTDSPGRIRGPVWSPDDRMIAVNHESDAGGPVREMWIVPVPASGRTTQETTRIELPRETFSMPAGWTANDTIGILLASPSHQAVYTVPTGGGRATQITPETRDGYPCYPKWSPDGRGLCLRWGRGSIASIPAQGGDLRVVHDADKANIVAGIPGGGYGISPDGREIVFMAAEQGSQPLEVSIWTVPAAGGEARQITRAPSPNQDRYPCWSPDGKSVAFLRYVPGPSPLPEILLTSSGGGATRRITSDYNKVDLGSIDWSPDGKWIAYFSRDDTINLVPAEGGEHKVLLDVGNLNHSWFSDLAWSPDGSELAFTAAGRLMVVSVKSGQTREIQTGVLEKGVENFYIDWSPDGGKLAFSAAFGGDEELWLMEDFLRLVKHSK